MIMHMRTTINIDDRLLDKLKERASETASSVSKLIEEAVKVMINRRPPDDTAPNEFELVTFGEGGRFSRHNIDKTSSLFEEEDLEKYGRREK
jgi:predicted transcriptional regulator